MSDKITQAEMVELFGASIPMDVAVLIDRWPTDDGSTIGNLRAVLTARATAYDDEKQMARDYHILYEQLKDLSERGYC